jgi:hypothetical protein
MLMGSMYGGLALTAAGTAAVHALAYPLGGMFNITHGVANSMLLPHVMAFNLDAIVDRLAKVAHALQIARHDDSDQAPPTSCWRACANGPRCWRFRRTCASSVFRSPPGAAGDCRRQGQAPAEQQSQGARP